MIRFPFSEGTNQRGRLLPKKLRVGALYPFPSCGRVEALLLKEMGPGAGGSDSRCMCSSRSNKQGIRKTAAFRIKKGDKMAPTTLKREEIIQKAEKKGRMALVDPVPDPTEAGKAMWKQNIREYFTEVCNNMVEEYNAQEMRADILAGLEKGFEDVIKKQPEMDVPVSEALQLFRDEFKQIH